MSIINDKLNAAVNAIDWQQLVKDRAIVKIDAILANRNINQEIDKIVKTSVRQSIKSELEE